MSASLKLVDRYGTSPEVKFGKFRARDAKPLSKYVQGTDYEITAEKPGALEFIIWTDLKHSDPKKYESFELNLILSPVFAGRAIHIDLVGLCKELTGDENRYMCKLLDKHSTAEQS